MNPPFVAGSGQTRIADLVPNPTTLATVVAKTYAAKNTLITSGLAATGPEVDLLMSGGSQVQGLSFINKVDTTQYNHSSDDYDQKGAVGKITAGRYMALRQDLNWGWATTDLVRMITKFYPTGYVEQAIPLFWNEVGENIATASLMGAIGSNAALTINNSTKALSLEMLVDAETAFRGGATNIVVNRRGEAAFKKLNINAYVPAKETDLNVANFSGYNLFVKEDLADGEMLVGGNGAVAFASGVIPGTIPMEISRSADAGNGGGGEILRTRRSFVVAPQGFNYKGSIAPNLLASTDDNAAAFANSLRNPANWEATGDLEDIAVRLVKFKLA